MIRTVVFFFAALCISGGLAAAACASEANAPPCQQFSETRLCGEPALELPAQVVAEVRDLADQCKEVGGKPLSGPAVEHGRLTSGPEFWTVDEVALECEGAWGLFSNAHGWNSAIFVTPSGGEIKRFAVVGFGIKSEPGAGSSKLWAAVAGANCGQMHARSTAEMIGCERELLWRADSQQLDFASLSQARFTTASTQENPPAPAAPKANNVAQLRLAALSPAGPVTRVYTKIDDVRADRYGICKVVQRSGTSDNPVLEERCPPGPDGWTVSMFSADAREYVHFGRTAKGGKTVSDALEGAFAEPNNVIEWRVLNGKPFAAIHRYFLDNRQVLTIHRLQADKTSCVAALVNVRKGVDANDQAIKIADRLGTEFQCSRDTLVVD
ncbi:hypothetical protein ACFQX9_36650 [Bradyrhizobium sp. GCM10028915]|uniref:hypothetical protein n=1 Tax=Bradyrhizobium sp. GCM10028915 TaxID=3273385 RepID=UPI003611E250